jgi:curved DNA-binding protein
MMTAARAAEVLGVALDCGLDPLAAAFRVSVKRVHPDRPGGDAAQLRAVIEAYDLLRARPLLPAPSGAMAPPPPPILEITPIEALNGLRRAATAPDGRSRQARLPPGLRAGDKVRLGGEVLTVAIAGDSALAVIGDHLCISLTVEPAWVRTGGALHVETPRGPRTVRVTRQDAVRGLTRLTGEGLPARGARPAGDLLVRLIARVEPVDQEPYESPTRLKLRRFTADWAA